MRRQSTTEMYVMNEMEKNHSPEIHSSLFASSCWKFLVLLILILQAIKIRGRRRHKKRLIKLNNACIGIGLWELRISDFDGSKKNLYLHFLFEENKTRLRGELH
jgi:hypothetical protein